MMPFITRVSYILFPRREIRIGTSKQSAREERRARRRGEAVDAIRMLQDALPLASKSTSDADSDDCSTIGNTSTGESAMDTDELQLPSARRQMKRKGSRNSSSKSDKRKRPGTKTVAVEVFQPIQSVHPQAKDARVPSVVLREMAVNAELAQQAVRTKKVVNTNVGIRIQPPSAASPHRLRHEGTVPFVPTDGREAPQGRHPRSLRGVTGPRYASQGFQHASCKRMVVGAARRAIPLVFVQLTKNEAAKKISSVTHICRMNNVTVESKLRKDQVTQCHRCQLYGHGQRNFHAAAVCVNCARPHQTAECTKPRDTASYRGYPKSPYNNRREAPAPTPRLVAPKPTPRPAPKKPETRKPQLQLPKEAPTAMETDAARPSTSTAKPSYAAAVKKSAAKTVARKPKALGKSKPQSQPPDPSQRRKSRKHRNPANQLNRQAPRTPPETSPGRGPPGRNPTRPRKPQSLQISTPTVFPRRRPSWRNSSRGTNWTRSSSVNTLPNFRVYPTDKEDARKSTIGHHADLALYLINIEATAVTVNQAIGPVKLVAAYKAPNWQVLEDDLSEIFDTRGAVVLAGDLNAKHLSWNSRWTNATCTCLRRFADDLHLLVDATAEPTIFPHNGPPDILDIMVMKDVAQFRQLTVLNELSSAHNPVLLQLGQAAPEDEDPRTRQTVSWPAFANHLSRPHRSYHGDRRPDRARSSSTPSHEARIRQRTVRNQHHACRRQQGLYPQGSPRPDTGEEPAPKTMAENVKPG
ncbi:hypothetical protein Trydic_g667 [Trypoxylus dichotomus]